MFSLSLRIYIKSREPPFYQDLLVILHKAKMAESSASFTIVHRDRSGKPDFVYSCDDKLASLVVASINVCRGMLRDPKIRSAFVSFAREYNRSGSVPRAWYRDPYYGYESMEDVVNTYIEVILASFPIVYIDDSITSPSCLAACPRRPWIHHFQPRDQSILLNGPVCGIPGHCTKRKLIMI